MAFLEAFGGNISPGLQYCGVVYNGASLALERALLLGSVDVLDEAVYWLFANGVLRCCSALALQRAGPAAGKTSWLAIRLACELGSQAGSSLAR